MEFLGDVLGAEDSPYILNRSNSPLDEQIINQIHVQIKITTYCDTGSGLMTEETSKRNSKFSNSCELNSRIPSSR